MSNEVTTIEETSMSSDCKLTTFDNPFDPFEQFDEWFRFDVEKGYYSCSKLARIASITDDMSQKEIDEIIYYDFTNTYRKVTRKTEAIEE